MRSNNTFTSAEKIAIFDKIFKEAQEEEQQIKLLTIDYWKGSHGFYEDIIRMLR